jgi:hypothetical protein
MTDFSRAAWLRSMAAATAIASLSAIAGCAPYVDARARVSHPSGKGSLGATGAPVDEGWYSITELSNRRVCVDYRMNRFEADTKAGLAYVGDMLKSVRAAETTFAGAGQPVRAKIVKTVGPEKEPGGQYEVIAGVRWCTPNEGLISPTASSLVVRTKVPISNHDRTVTFTLHDGKPKTGAWGAKGGRSAVKPLGQRKVEGERSRKRFREGLKKERAAERKRIDRLSPQERARERERCFADCRKARRRAKHNPKRVYSGCVDRCLEKYPKE